MAIPKGFKLVSRSPQAPGSEIQPVDATPSNIPVGFKLVSPAAQLPAESGGDGGIVDSALAVIEPAATIASGIVAEPVAGLAGIAQSLNPFADPGAGGRAVEATREALTFQPRSEAGKAGLQAVGEAIAPVGEVISTVESALGDATFKATGSPALAAAATTFPTLVGELLGGAVGGAAVKGAQKTAKAAQKAIRKGQISRELAQAIPTTKDLRATSSALFKEIDDLGAAVKANTYQSIDNQLKDAFDRFGGDPDITPKAAKALRRFNEVAETGLDVPLGELDKLRTVAGNAAKSLEPAEAAIGSSMVDVIDEALTNLSPRNFTGVAKGAKIGKKIKFARNLWGRAKRSELIETAFEKARNQASGFENGIRTQFRSILNSKKQRRFFNDSEIKAMNRVVRGTKKENIAKLVGRLGVGEGGSTSLVGASIGAAGGSAAFGPLGAVIVPAIGTVSRKLAQRLTVKNAEFADDVIRAGKDARKITDVYIENVPKKQRSPQELSELLTSPDIDLNFRNPNPLAEAQSLIRTAVELARKQRIAATAQRQGVTTGVAGATAVPGIEEQAQQQSNR